MIQANAFIIELLIEHGYTLSRRPVTPGGGGFCQPHSFQSRPAHALSVTLTKNTSFNPGLNNVFDVVIDQEVSSQLVQAGSEIGSSDVCRA
jgi:hypothetical protein